MDLKRVAKKLQQGLAARGIRVRINRYQHFSPEKGRFLTKYAVIREANEEKKRGKTILETYRMIDVVRTLAGMLEVTDGDAQ